MASPNILKGGIGGTTGAVFARVSRLQYSGEVSTGSTYIIHVRNTTGSARLALAA